MEKLRERDKCQPIQPENPGYSELSFVEALAHPNETFGDPQEVVSHPGSPTRRNAPSCCPGFATSS